MHLHKAVEKLEAAWGDEAGFLFKLRMGEFDSSRANEFVALLQELDVDEGSPIDRRTVSLLWYLPAFIRWQRERVAPGLIDELDRLETLVMNELERILGVP